MRFRVSTPATTIWPDWITTEGRGLSHAEYARLEEQEQRRCTRLALERDGDRKGCVARWNDAQREALQELAGSYFHVGDSWERSQSITNKNDLTQDEDKGPRERKEEQPMFGGIKKLLGRSKAATTTDDGAAVELELEEESTVEQETTSSNVNPSPATSPTAIDRIRELKAVHARELAERDQRITELGEQLSFEQQRAGDLQARLSHAESLQKDAEARAAEAERFRREIEQELGIA